MVLLARALGCAFATHGRGSSLRGDTWLLGARLRTAQEPASRTPGIRRVASPELRASGLLEASSSLSWALLLTCKAPAAVGHAGG